MSGLSLQDIEWLKRHFTDTYQCLDEIRMALVAIRKALPQREEGVKTDRPADAGETKW